MAIPSLLPFPAPNRDCINIFERAILRETMHDLDELEAQVSRNEPQLADDQRTAYEAVLSKVNPSFSFLFLDAPGGTGKTFTTNLLLAKVRLQGNIALAVASSGTAATLLNGGRTAHSAFKLPLNLVIQDDPVCNISKGTGEAEVLKSAKLIVWDECSMSHKKAFEALDRTLKDLKENNLLFGGVTVLICGDFRQTLPVVPKGTTADEYNACLKKSVLWRSVERFQLTTNMRVHLRGDQDAGLFASLLLQIGNGQVPKWGDNLITVPESCGTLVETKEELIDKVYPNLGQHYKNVEWLRDRAILAPKNTVVSELNEKLLELQPGTIKAYLSIDKTIQDVKAIQYPTEFLNSINPQVSLQVCYRSKLALQSCC